MKRNLWHSSSRDVFFGHPVCDFQSWYEVGFVSFVLHVRFRQFFSKFSYFLTFIVYHSMLGVILPDREKLERIAAAVSSITSSVFPRGVNLQCFPLYKALSTVLRAPELFLEIDRSSRILFLLQILFCALQQSCLVLHDNLKVSWWLLGSDYIVVSEGW